MAEVSAPSRTYFQHDYLTGKVYLKYKERGAIPQEWLSLAKEYAPTKGVNAGVVHWRVFFDNISVKNPIIETVDTTFGQQYRIFFQDKIQGEEKDCCLSLACEDLTALKIVLFLKRNGSCDIQLGKYPIIRTGGVVLQSELDYLMYDQATKGWVKNPAFSPEAGKATWYKACEFAFTKAEDVETGKKEIGIPQKLRIAIAKSGATFWKAYTVKVRAYVDDITPIVPATTALVYGEGDLPESDDSEDLPF